MKVKSKFLKIIGSLALAGTAFIASSCSAFNSNSSGSSTSTGTSQGQTQKLGKVTNISYDASTKILSWSLVDHANQYNLNINGSVQKVDSNSMYFVPVQKTSSVKVQAYDTNGEYITSDWSDTFTYTIPDQKKLTLAEVNTFVNNFKSSYKLKRITSMYITSADSKYYKGVLHAQGVFTVNGNDKTVDMERRYDEEIKSLSDAMTQKAQSTSIENEYTLADYNSAQYLIDSNSYAGKMEEYRQRGWDFSVVSSCAGYRDKDFYLIYSTYKLTKGSETKYIQNEVNCTIVDLDSSVKNYTTKLLNSSDRFLTEISCNECTEENRLLTLAQLLEENQAQKTASAKKSNTNISTNYSYNDGGMEF